jgi:hypothetical protein
VPPPLLRPSAPPPMHPPSPPLPRTPCSRPSSGFGTTGPAAPVEEPKKPLAGILPSVIPERPGPAKKMFSPTREEDEAAGEDDDSDSDSDGDHENATVVESEADVFAVAVPAPGPLLTFGGSSVAVGSPAAAAASQSVWDDVAAPVMSLGLPSAAGGPLALGGLPRPTPPGTGTATPVGASGGSGGTPVLGLAVSGAWSGLKPGSRRGSDSGAGLVSASPGEARPGSRKGSESGAALLTTDLAPNASPMPLPSPLVTPGGHALHHTLTVGSPPGGAVAPATGAAVGDQGAGPQAVPVLRQSSAEKTRFLEKMKWLEESGLEVGTRRSDDEVARTAGGSGSGALSRRGLRRVRRCVSRPCCPPCCPLLPPCCAPCCPPPHAAPLLPPCCPSAAPWSGVG